MVLKDQMLLDLDVFFNVDEFASVVTYRPATGDPVQIKAVFDTDRQRRDSGADQAWLYVKKADVPSPSYRDTFVIDGEEWKIQQRPGQGRVVFPAGGAWQIRITAREAYGR